MDEKMFLHPMQVTDLMQVMDIEFISFPDPWSRQVFYDEIANDQLSYNYVLKTKKDQVIGYCGFWLVLDEAQMTKIAIHPAYCGQGWAKKMMIYCMAQSRVKGAKKMTLEVRASNKEAQILYEKLGFASAGIRPSFYKVEPEDAVMMWVNLDEETNHTWN